MSKAQVNWIITDQNVTVNYNGQTHIIARSNSKLADKLIEALRTKRFDEIPNIVSAAKRVAKFSKGTFVLRDGDIYVNGVAAPAALGKKILRFSDDGLPYQPLVKFAENLQRNPSFRAVNELFTFLEKNDHPITETGKFIAYKRVSHDFTDIYTGKFDNSVGKVVEMSRNAVNEDCTQTCSYGLHVANWDYAHTKYSTAPDDIMLEVEVDPADVVAVPVDYDNSKMRVCRYKVLGVVDKEHSSDVTIRVVDQERYDDLVDDKDDEEEDCCDLCGEEFCDGECEEEDGCEFCGDVFCFGECEDEEEDAAYPFDSEL